MTERPEAAAIAEPEIGLRSHADDPIATVVKAVRVERRDELCRHQLPFIVIDGERWHHEPGTAAESYAFCVPAPKGRR